MLVFINNYILLLDIFDTIKMILLFVLLFKIQKINQRYLQDIYFICEYFKEFPL